jgi:hypothetical protein
VSIALLAGIFEELPSTDEEMCEDALVRGDYWHASFYCPAGTFLGSLIGDDDYDDEENS